eukprot:scaffold2586_cov256-Skeletonema_marinoi.AAC.5
MREVFGDTSPAYTEYYIRFIGHFVNVYEGTAPMFARELARWPEDPANIQAYIDNGRFMKDVLGLLIKLWHSSLRRKQMIVFCHTRLRFVANGRFSAEYLQPVLLLSLMRTPISTFTGES